jgi:hypothetical protein
MAELPFIKMTNVQAANFRDQTAAYQHKLDPRRVDAGVHIGSYVLPARVKYDPLHADKLIALTLLQEVVIDINEAWPPVEE